jgi:O-antigen/teichoic acid export membrane protein
MSTSKTERALVSGSFWASAGETTSAVVGLVINIIAARIIAPESFGLMGTVALAISILDAFAASGFEEALVQREKDVEDLLNVVWTWHLLRGLAFVVILCVAAPFIAAWYHDHRLLLLIVVASAYALLFGVRNVGVTLYTRNLKFRTIFFINLGQTFFRIAVFLPAILLMRNVWALLIGYLGGALASFVISYVAHPYRPRWEWNRAKFRVLFNYGKWVTIMTGMSFVMTQGDDVFVSKYLGLASLAFYQMAYSISNLPATQITHVLARASFPTYSRLQGDRDAVRRAFKNVSRATLLISGPISVFIYVIAPDIVAQVVGPKWAAIIPLIHILVIAGFIRSFAALAGFYFNAVGRPDVNFKMNLPRFVVIVALVWPLAAHWGLRGACIAVVISISATLPVWFYGIRRLANIGPLEVLGDNVLAILSSALLAVTLQLVRRELGPSLLGFLGSVVLGTGLWLAGLWLLGRISPWDFYAEIGKLRAAGKK